MIKHQYFFRMTIDAMKTTGVDQSIDNFRAHLEYKPEFAISGVLDISRMICDEPTLPMLWSNKELPPHITEASIRAALIETGQIQPGINISRRLKFYYTKNQGG